MIDPDLFPETLYKVEIWQSNYEQKRHRYVRARRIFNGSGSIVMYQLLDRDGRLHEYAAHGVILVQIIEEELQFN